MKALTRAVLTTGALLMGVGAAAAQEGIRPAVLITTTPTTPPGAPRSALSVVTERLMSFDANHDQRISRDELPTRMQGLLTRGDKNADAALDADEIRALVTTASSERTRVFFRPQSSEGLPGVISDLKLPAAKRERALAIVKAHTVAPTVIPPESSDLFKEMRLVLDDEEYENFVAAATRLSRTAQMKVGIGIAGGVVGTVAPPKHF